MSDWRRWSPEDQERFLDKFVRDSGLHPVEDDEAENESDGEDDRCE